MKQLLTIKLIETAIMGVVGMTDNILLILLLKRRILKPSRYVSQASSNASNQKSFHLHVISMITTLASSKETNKMVSSF